MVTGDLVGCSALVERRLSSRLYSWYGCSFLKDFSLSIVRMVHNFALVILSLLSPGAKHSSLAAEALGH